MTASPITIDVISDVMCPWCLIGKRRLEKALAAHPEIPVEVRWRPFQLDPTIPENGMSRKEYLENKFGAEGAKEAYDRIRETGKADDIEFDFESIEKSPNTLNAHRLIRWAAAFNAQDAMVERLFSLFFLEGEDLSDQDTLLNAAEDAGLEREVVERLLAGDADKDEVRQEIVTAGQMGVTGVPCFIVDQKYAVMGAQPSDVIAGAISKAHGERSAV
ncbi:MAG: DsbA family oxidoreductase [Hyphomicrobiales bacterium]